MLRSDQVPAKIEQILHRGMSDHEPLILVQIRELTWQYRLMNSGVPDLPARPVPALKLEHHRL